MDDALATILLVNDNDDISKFLTILFQKHHYQLVIAADSRRAQFLCDHYPVELVVFAPHLLCTRQSQVLFKNLSETYPVIMLKGMLACFALEMIEEVGLRLKTQLKLTPGP